MSEAKDEQLRALALAAIKHSCECCASGGYRSNCNCDEERLLLAIDTLLDEKAAAVAERNTLAEEIKLWRKRVASMQEEYDAMVTERDEARAWVRDLQSGMYINCVYCGHRYGPEKDTPVAMADVLKEHIAQCPRHPMSALKTQAERAEARIADLRDAIELARSDRHMPDRVEVTLSRALAADDAAAKDGEMK
jgi:hypothetical protein